MISHRTSTATLLLDLLAFTDLGGASVEAAVAELAGTHGRTGLVERIRNGVAVLEVEGLVASRPERGQLVYGATAAGRQALEQRGRGTREATVLFTDLVGSTALIGTFGEAEAHALRLRHFALLRGAVAAHRGREVKSLGDGLLVVFADPADATACATAMQQAVAGDADGLGLRVGLHTGELLREDDDVHGSTVIIASRLCDSAEAGQIIVSETTRALTESGPAKSLGGLSLKGLGQPVGAFALRWAGRPAGAQVAAA